MTWVGAGLMVCAGALAAPAAAHPGQWQVRQVLVHEDRADRLLYQVNDPRLVGRMVAINAQQIESDLPEASVCGQPALLPRELMLNSLLVQTMPSALPGQDAARAFGLAASGQANVKLAWTGCTTGQFGPSLKASRADREAPPGGHWMALVAPGQLLMPWYGDTLLVLEPWPSGKILKPSFSCSQATHAAEQAICASPRLASYDLSLATAWHAAAQWCDGDAKCLREARRAQKQWLDTRNRCGRHETCLQQAMKARLETLMSPVED